MWSEIKEVEWTERREKNLWPHEIADLLHITTFWASKYFIERSSITRERDELSFFIVNFDRYFFKTTNMHTFPWMKPMWTSFNELGCSVGNSQLELEPSTNAACVQGALDFFEISNFTFDRVLENSLFGPASVLNTANVWSLTQRSESVVQLSTSARVDRWRNYWAPLSYRTFIIIVETSSRQLIIFSAYNLV